MPPKPALPPSSIRPLWLVGAAAILAIASLAAPQILHKLPFFNATVTSTTNILHAFPSLPTLAVTLVFTCFASSVGYYAIATLLSLSPPTSGIGLLLMRRVHHAKLNWHAHVIRSFLETGFWLSVIGFTYLRDVSWDSSRRWLVAVGWGTISGVGVVLLGDAWTRYLGCLVCNVWDWEVRLQVEDSCASRRNSDANAQDKGGDYRNKTGKTTTCASFGTFTLLYLFSFLGYHTLSFIFSFPYSLLPHHLLSLLPNLLLLHIFLATLSGLTFIATANLFMRISHTEELGELLLKRVTHFRENWKTYPGRSARELGGWLVVVSGSFHSKYYNGRGIGVEDYDHVCNDWSGNGDTCENGDNLHRNSHVTRGVWALVWALQLGTLMGCVLVLVGLYWNGEKVGEMKSAAIARCVSSNDDSSSTKTSSTETTTSTTTESPIMSVCPIREKARENGLVLFDGYWYSVGNFVPHHPGGAAVLEQYLGAVSATSGRNELDF